MGKHEKRQRKKKLRKQIASLQKQQEDHITKIETSNFREDFQKDTTQEYWKKEVENFEKVEERKTNLLKKLEKRKR